MKRPMLIWLALVYLAIVLAGHMLGVLRTMSLTLSSGSDGMFTFLFAVVMSILILATLDAIRRRVSVARKLGIAIFVLLALFGLYNLWVLYSWPENLPDMNMSLAKLFIYVRVGVSLSFAALFTFSRTIKEYFEAT